MTKRFALTALLISVTLSVATLARAQDARTEDVRFAPGTSGATLSDRISGREYVVYRIGAEAGQRMDITLTSSNTATYFNVYEPGRQPGDEALANSEMTGPMVPAINRFSGDLSTSGVYSVSVYLYRNAARDGETSDFTVDISVTGAMGAVVEGDFADGLQGGPDFWRVQADGGLKLRDAPSTGSSVLATLPNGLELRNLGCRMAEGRNWCNVATLADPGLEGWAAAEFLFEGSGGVATQLPDMVPVQQDEADALVPGTTYNATGSVECYLTQSDPMQMCDFGVIREGNGGGSVTITLPDGMTRTIFYDNGKPVNFDKSEADGEMFFGAEKMNDGFGVIIGQSSFIIPDAVIYGG